MAEITLKGNPCNTCGELPAAGSDAIAFSLVGGDLGTVDLASFDGKTVVLNIVPSLDTPVCSVSATKFNEAANGLENTVVVNASKDLPFAQKRVCESNKLENITNASGFRSDQFGKDYGVEITDGPLQGLYARAVVVIKEGKVVYSQLVPEIAEEPDYDSALAAAK
ncbi:MAG: thiol peroxidase [Planctomycetota bacterium]